MPELPEVENIAQGLRHEIIGWEIAAMRVRQAGIIAGPFKRKWRKTLEQYQGLKITSVTRRGKRLILLTDGQMSLLIQLGMTGKFVLSDPKEPLEKHAHLIVDFQNGRQLRFVDTRRFGRVWLLAGMAHDNLDPIMEQAGMGKMGPEPFDIAKKEFRKLFSTQRMAKTLLLDQVRIAGLGNIYVDESLFAAAIHPETRCHTLQTPQIDKLLKEIQAVLRRSINAGGTTFSDFRNAYGDMGNFKKKLKVYSRTSQPCKRCKTPIQRIVVTGRSSHFCPRCQPQ